MKEKKSCKFTECLKKNVVLTTIIALILGLVIGAGIVRLLSGKLFLGKVGAKLLTTKNTYSKMKNYYSIDLFLEDIDKAILDKKYKLNEEELDEIKKMADYYIEQYEQYGYTKEKFLSENGFESYEDFVDYLSIDYKRTVYYYDFVEAKLEENAVKKYYEENGTDKIKNKHILVKTSDDLSDEEALKIANEIIARLQNGENFDELAEEYTQSNVNIITEDLGETGAFDNLETSYMEALKTLEEGKYTVSPVKTSYGYHIIYCEKKIEKTDEISRKDKMAIIDILGADIMGEDSNLYNKALINMRKESKFKFFDKDLNLKYEEYCAQYIDED